MKIFTLIHHDEEDNHFSSVSFTTKELAVSYAETNFDLLPHHVTDLETKNRTKWEMYNDGQFEGHLIIVETKLIGL